MERQLAEGLSLLRDAPDPAHCLITLPTRTCCSRPAGGSRGVGGSRGRPPSCSAGARCAGGTLAGCGRDGLLEVAPGGHCTQAGWGMGGRERGVDSRQCRWENMEQCGPRSLHSGREYGKGSVGRMV